MLNENFQKSFANIHKKEENSDLLFEKTRKQMKIVREALTLFFEPPQLYTERHVFFSRPPKHAKKPKVSKAKEPKEKKANNVVKTATKSKTIEKNNTTTAQKEFRKEFLLTMPFKPKAKAFGVAEFMGIEHTPKFSAPRIDYGDILIPTVPTVSSSVAPIAEEPVLPILGVPIEKKTGAKTKKETTKKETKAKKVAKKEPKAKAKKITKPQTWVEKIRHVLQKTRRMMHPVDIVDHIKKEKMLNTKGKTPTATVIGTLSTALKKARIAKTPCDFVHKHGCYGLASIHSV